VAVVEMMLEAEAVLVDIFQQLLYLFHLVQVIPLLLVLVELVLSQLAQVVLVAVRYFQHCLLLLVEAGAVLGQELLEQQADQVVAAQVLLALQEQVELLQ
jgi:hypothetical protein